MMNQFHHEYNHYSLIAAVFRYPDARIEDQVGALRKMVNGESSEKQNELNEVLDKLGKMKIGEQQEYYLKTFDVQAVCTLDIGYLLFGEDYKRAQLLVNLKNEHQHAGVDCREELADHLPNLLELLAKSNDPEITNELAFILLIPAVKFMLLKFKHVENYYRTLLGILLDCLEADFKGNGLESYRIPDEMLKEENEFLFPSPKDLVCENSCHLKSY